MERAHRVIDLVSVPKTADGPVSGMLVWIRRDRHTDTYRIDVFIGNFQTVVAYRGGIDPGDPWAHTLANRAGAIAMARQFIDAIGYIGQVRWKIGENGVIIDEPQS
jgi:hypothetical protein